MKRLRCLVRGAGWLLVALACAVVLLVFGREKRKT